MKTSLCAVGDAMELTKSLDRYEDIDYTFSGSREGKLLRVRPPEHVQNASFLRAGPPFPVAMGINNLLMSHDAVHLISCEAPPLSMG